MGGRQGGMTDSVPGSNQIPNASQHQVSAAVPGASLPPAQEPKSP